MSLTIEVFAVPWDPLVQALGCGDQALIKTIVARHGWLLPEADESEGREFGGADALADLINGETDERFPGSLYGFALMALCAHVGKSLPNVPGIARAFEWMERIDAGLLARSIPLSLQELVCSGSPVPIPLADDWPTVGIWVPETIEEALAALQAHDPSQDDYELAEMIVQIKGWLEAAAKLPGSSLIGFMS